MQETIAKKFSFQQFMLPLLSNHVEENEVFVFIGLSKREGET